MWVWKLENIKIANKPSWSILTIFFINFGFETMYGLLELNLF